MLTLSFNSTCASALGLHYCWTQSASIIDDGIWQPPVNASWQIVLAGTLDIDTNSPSVSPSWVDVFDIDLYTNTKNGTDDSTIRALHSLDKKVICYFSAGTYEPYRSDSNKFLDSDKGNTLKDWPDEQWLNLNSQNVRDIMTTRIKVAADMGCDAIDPDNVDGYGEAPKNNGFTLTQQDSIDYMQFLVDTAKPLKLAVGLKNAGEIVDKVAPTVQFSVNEECAANAECLEFKSAFIDADKPVFHIEYPDSFPTKDLSEYCSKAPEDGAQATDVSLFSTVIQQMSLGGNVEYCDGSTFTTSVVPAS